MRKHAFSAVFILLQASQSHCLTVRGVGSVTFCFPWNNIATDLFLFNSCMLQGDVLSVYKVEKLRWFGWSFHPSVFEVHLSPSLSLPLPREWSTVLYTNAELFCFTGSHLAKPHKHPLMQFLSAFFLPNHLMFTYCNALHSISLPLWLFVTAYTEDFQCFAPLHKTHSTEKVIDAPYMFCYWLLSLYTMPPSTGT